MRIPIPPYVLLTLCSLFWAGHLIVVRAIHQDIPPITLNFWRWVVVAVMLLPFVGRDLWAQRALIRRHIRIVFGLSVLGAVIFQGGAYIALNTTTAINAGLLHATTPVGIAIFAFLFFRERLTTRQACGITMSLVGVVTVLVKADAAALAALAFTVGDIWMLLAVAAWALYSVLLRIFPAEISPMLLLGAMTVIAVPVLLPFYAWEWSRQGGFDINATNVGAIVAVALFASIGAYTFWNQAVSEVGANKAGLFLHLMPVFIAAMAITFLGEVIRPYHVAGAVLIFSGIYLTVASQARAHPQSGS
ncbi:MAG: DMT family transporter [Rhodospirillales bacterium]|jgi:drug/metabolite transporter (DMT)-like permease|nr:DMT family transporter [Rhodospirillales bacterium]